MVCDVVSGSRAVLIPHDEREEIGGGSHVWDPPPYFFSLFVSYPKVPHDPV
ncbi:uncharacterized protein G2W53_006859 [Senna tora]|uniref:Uncharacterized protein n=1 Tax=Senna tora TaxID=362788 RepID=A0A834X5X3_9FABA|nr:uncharacterized protein G2W53_006859 [Senna tora]